MIRETLQGLHMVADYHAHCATVFNTKAELAEAEYEKAKAIGDSEAPKHRKAVDYNKERRTAHLEMLDWTRQAIDLLKPRAKRAAFQPPTKGEALAHAENAMRGVIYR